jgi:hypothetical protein
MIPLLCNYDCVADAGTEHAVPADRFARKIVVF